MTHATMVNGRSVFGPSHNVTDHLRGRGQSALLVAHPLGGPGSTELLHYDGKDLCCRHEIVLPFAGPLRWITELVFNLAVLVRMRRALQIIVDPLNQLAAALASGFGMLERNNVFYGVDYAEDRFHSRALNRAYHVLDRCAVRTARAVWSVSMPLVEVRRRQGVPPERNHLVTNAPPIGARTVRPRHARRPMSAVLMGNFERGYDLSSLVRAFSGLARRFPEARLALIGEGASLRLLLSELNEAGISDKVEALGMLEHEQALRESGDRLVGLAPYGSGDAWHHYRDSMKIREYFALGLPVITTPGHWLAEEIARVGAGDVVSAATEIEDAMARLLTDAEEWRRASAAAETMARQYDRDVVLGSLLPNSGGRSDDNEAAAGRCT